MDQQRLRELEEIITRDYVNTTGLVMRKNGRTVYEGYFHGYTAEDSVHTFSVTKSVFSALMGIAIEKGFIHNVDQRVLDFFPEYTVPAGEKTIQSVTLRHLLTMTAPYKCGTEPFEEFFASGDWVNFALGLLGGERHTGQFVYSPIVGSHILSGILAKAIGGSILAFAQENLFAPLDIRVPRDVLLADKEAHMAVMSDRSTCGWVADQQGRNAASWGLFLTPVEMAKFGQLYADGGVWNGRQVVPSAWIAESTREQSRWGELSYGYLWWVLNPEEHSYAALGDGGNVIYVNTKKQLVVSIASLFMPEAKDRLELIMERIEPMLET